MERFVRLRSEDATEFERRLLDSAVDDAPSAAARARTLAALGIGAGAVATGALSGAAHAASLSAAHEVGASGAAKTGSVALSVLLKWLGAGAAAGLVTAGTLAVATAPAPAASGGTVTSVVSGSKLAEPVVATPVRVARPPLPDVASSRFPEVPAVLGAPPVATGESVLGAPALPRSEHGGTSPSSPVVSNDANRAPPADDASHVVEEVHSLDFARAALEGGNARTALERLAAHDARFPGGTLEPEAVVLRVRAWLALGRRADAAAAANAFLSTHPRSPQASRLRALVGP